MTRRAAVGALAAAVAISPGGVAAAVPAKVISATADHPDRGLIEMGQRYRKLEALERAAHDRYQARCEAYQRREPRPPEALHHRLTDHLGCLHLPMVGTCQAGISCDHLNNDFYSEEEIKRLRYSPPPFDVEHIAEQKSRIEEIEQAWEHWSDECSTVAEATGVYEAEDALEEIREEQYLVLETIELTPATSLEGLRAKASIIVGIDKDAGFWADMHQSIVRDLLAMTA